MLGGPEGKVEIGLAWARGQLSLQHRDSFGKLSAVGEMLSPGQSESDRLARAASRCEQSDIPDHSAKFGGPLFRRSQFGKEPADERTQPRRIKLRQHSRLSQYDRAKRNEITGRKPSWWERQDSNLRRHSQRIYSPPPLPLGTLSPKAVAPY